MNTDSHKFDEYLDNKLNPSFPVDMTQKRTVRKRNVIVFFSSPNDYNMVCHFIMMSPSTGSDFAAHTGCAYKRLQFDISQLGYCA